VAPDEIQLTRYNTLKYEQFCCLTVTGLLRPQYCKAFSIDVEGLFRIFLGFVIDTENRRGSHSADFPCCSPGSVKICRNISAIMDNPICVYSVLGHGKSAMACPQSARPHMECQRSTLLYHQVKYCTGWTPNSFSLIFSIALTMAPAPVIVVVYGIWKSSAARRII